MFYGNDLDSMQCSNPGCTEDHGELYIHSRCHPESPTWARYEKGALTIVCAECGQNIMAIGVEQRIPWQALQTNDSKQVAECLRKVYEEVDAYRYNSASIRVRVRDRCFAGHKTYFCVEAIEEALQELPERLQGDVISLTVELPAIHGSSAEFEDTTGAKPVSV